MFAKIKKYFQENQERGQMIIEGRELLQALELPSGQGSDLQIASVLMRIGLACLRLHKSNLDKAKAARQMDALISDPQMPRPSYEKALTN